MTYLYHPSEGGNHPSGRPFKSSLERMAYVLLEQQAAGRTQVDIAAELGISTKRVSQIVNDAWRRIGGWKPVWRIGYEFRRMQEQRDPPNTPQFHYERERYSDRPWQEDY